VTLSSGNAWGYRGSDVTVQLPLRNFKNMFSCSQQRTTRPVTSLGHKVGPNFFKQCPIISNYVQHFPRGEEILGGSPSCVNMITGLRTTSNNLFFLSKIVQQRFAIIFYTPKIPAGCGPAIEQWFPTGVSRRGVTRWDGARGKKQVWRPRVRNWGLSEANVLYWRKYLQGRP